MLRNSICQAYLENTYHYALKIIQNFNDSSGFLAFWDTTITLFCYNSFWKRVFSYLFISLPISYCHKWFSYLSTVYLKNIFLWGPRGWVSNEETKNRIKLTNKSILSINTMNISSVPLPNFEEFCFSVLLWLTFWKMIFIQNSHHLTLGLRKTSLILNTQCT